MKKTLFILSLAIVTSGAFGQAKPKTAKSPAEFVPAGYAVYKELKGDLNKDGEEDHVLLIRGTDRKKFLDCKSCFDDEGMKKWFCGEGEDFCDHKCNPCHRVGQEDDLNPQGIIVAFKKGDIYELALENRCYFTPEPWGGGSHVPPTEPAVSIKRGNLFVEFWIKLSGSMYAEKSYNFQYRNSDFELIGYDCRELFVDAVLSAKSINFLSKKILTKESPAGAEFYRGEKVKKHKETWEDFTIKKPVRLREVANFNDFNVDEMIGK